MSSQPSFDASEFYTITAQVNGATLALTFILPEGVSRDTLTTNPSMAKVALEPLTPGDPRQQWQLRDAGVDPGDCYMVFSKVSSQDDDLTGVMEVQNPNSKFTPTASFRERYNRVTVGSLSNDISEYWQIVRAEGGFTIGSLLGLRGSWKEPRTLEVLVEDGVAVLDHGTAGFAWTFAQVA